MTTPRRGANKRRGHRRSSSSHRPDWNAVEPDGSENEDFGARPDRPTDKDTK